MKIFFSFIASVALVFFGFLYYLDSNAPSLEFPKLTADAASLNYRGPVAGAIADPVDSPPEKVFQASNRFVFDLNKPLRPVGPDTLKFIDGAPFWTQVAIRFDDDSTLVVNTRRFEQNEISLLENKNVQSRTNMRMFFVLDSLHGRQVWREVYRDNAVRSDVPLNEIELIRYKFLLKRSPPVF